MTLKKSELTNVLKLFDLVDLIGLIRLINLIGGALGYLVTTTVVGFGFVTGRGLGFVLAGQL